MSGKTTVKLLVLRVQHQENQVKPAEQGVGQLDVLHDSGTLVPLGHARVSSCQDRGSGIQRTDDTSFGYRQGLLLLWGRGRERGRGEREGGEEGGEGGGRGEEGLLHTCDAILTYYYVP